MWGGRTPLFFCSCLGNPEVAPTSSFCLEIPELVLPGSQRCPLFRNLSTDSPDLCPSSSTLRVLWSPSSPISRGGGTLDSYLWALSDSPGPFSPQTLLPVFSPFCLKHLVWFLFPEWTRISGEGEREVMGALLPWVFAESQEHITSLREQATHPGLQGEPAPC